MSYKLGTYFTRIGAWLQRRSLGGSALEWVRDTGMEDGRESLARPYAHSVWVQAAIRRVAGPIASVPLVFEPEAAEAEGFFENPAVGLTWPELVEASVGWLKLSGEFFWVMDDTWLGRGAGRSPLILARPERMQQVVSRTGELEGWVFTDAGGRRVSLLPEQVAQGKNWNPYHEHRGLSEYECAALAAEGDYYAGRFARNIAANNGDTGPIVIARGGMPNSEQREMVVRELRTKRQANLRGDFKPIFLAGDISVEDPKIKSPDAGFIGARLANRHEIFLAFGVPASMADVQQSYSIGSASDRYLLIEETCKPAGEKVARAAGRVASLMTRREIEAYLDWDEHSTMQQVRRERVDAAQKLWAMGMPMQLVSEYLGLDLPEYDGWEVGYLPFGLQPAGEAARAENPEERPEFDENTEVQEMLFALRQRRMDAANGRECTCGCDARTLERAPAQWREQMMRRRVWQKKFENRLRLNLMRARGEVLEKLNRAGQGQGEGERAGGQTRAAAADFLFDLKEFKEGVKVSLRPLWQGVLDAAGSELYEELGRGGDAFKYPPEAVKQFLRSRENRISGASDDIFGRIKKTLESGLEKGDTLSELATRVRSEFNEIGRGRAVTIAMTETNTAYGQGRQEGMVQAGVQWKKWLTSGAPNVRASHRKLEGVTVPVDEPFANGCMFPGDPNGRPKETINCHCTHIAVLEPGDDSAAEE